MIKSYNQQVICEPYLGARGIKSKISSGVAIVQQKTSVIGLKVLRDAVIDDSITIKKGDTLFIKEEILHTYKEFSQPLECSDISAPFILVNFGHVSFVKASNENK